MPGNIENHEKAMQAARRFARWHLGDISWADAIINAYNHPDDANRELDYEMSEGD